MENDELQMVLKESGIDVWAERSRKGTAGIGMARVKMVAGQFTVRPKNTSWKKLFDMGILQKTRRKAGQVFCWNLNAVKTKEI